MNALDVVLFLIACVFFGLAMIPVVVGKVNLVAAGLFAVALDFLLHALGVG